MCLWDTATGNHLATLAAHKEGVYNVAFSPDGNILASSGRGEIYLWDVPSRQQKIKLTEYANSVWTLAFSPDGKTLASGGMDRDVHLWDIKAGEHKIALTGHTDRITSVGVQSRWGKRSRVAEVGETERCVCGILSVGSTNRLS